MKVCIIGAGPTGLGAAYRLTQLGFDSFKVLERNPYVGGLATSFSDAQGFVWDLGVHVTHSHYTYFDRLLHDVLPDGYYRHERRSWIWKNRTYIPYPFQYNIRHLPPDEMQECVDGLLEISRNGTGPEPTSFEEWVLSKFGRGIARHFMLPYNRKIWCTPPSEMGYQWTGDRVPVCDVKRVQKNIALKQDDVAWGPNAMFDFPKQGGTGAIWKAMARRIPDGRLCLSCNVVGIDVKNKIVHRADGAQEPYEHLISTVPITQLIPLCKLDRLEPAARGLRHTHVKVLGVAPRHRLPPDLAGKTWVYCPGGESFYRLTPFSDFSPAHVPDPRQHCSVLCETSFPAGADLSDDRLLERTLQSLRDSGLLNVQPEETHTYVMDAPFGYPIPTRNRDSILNGIQPELEKLNIYSRGRFGGWKYEAANMDHSVMQGVEAVDRILNGVPERTLPTPAVANAGKI